MTSQSPPSPSRPSNIENIDPITFECNAILPRTTIELRYPIDSYDQESNIEKTGSADDDNDDIDPLTVFDQEQDLCEILNRARQEHIEELSQQILSQQPINDTTARLILSQWNFLRVPTRRLAATSSFEVDNTESHQQQYPPIIQSGIVAEAHRPYAAYGHLDRSVIAQELQFNLEPPSTDSQKRFRIHAKSFAITTWTTVSKDLVMDHIKNEFGIENIQYICISEEISELNHQRHLHIQIILKEKVDRRKPFLDEITGTKCNYQVTRNDLAWNEYIKKEGNYIEFNEFKSTRTRGQKSWPSRDPSITSSSSSPLVSNVTSKKKTTTVRGQNEARRYYEQETVIKALELAKTNVHQAMDHMRQALPTKFLSHSSWYLTTFNYIHLRAQEDIDRNGQIEKEYVWPLSFPQCTDQLRQAINRWIRHHFSRTKRAKCLILIGPSGTGKTSFALSLPGRVNYFKERWNLDHWSDYARYSVYDDIPWDEFSKLNYPNKKGLLTQNGRMNATDKYRGTKQINVRQPAIVLLNPEDAGSLLDEPVTLQQQQLAQYWKERAFVYVMNDDEYFYKRTVAQKQPMTTNEHLSGSSSMGANEARIGELDEFDQMIQRYQHKHS